MAEVIPFPRTRDRAFILRHARRMAELRPRAAENHLLSQLKIQADAMARKGVKADLAAQHIKALELAIRAELWRMVLTPPGAA